MISEERKDEICHDVASSLIKGIDNHWQEDLDAATEGSEEFEWAYEDIGLYLDCKWKHETSTFYVITLSIGNKHLQSTREVECSPGADAALDGMKRNLVDRYREQNQLQYAVPVQIFTYGPYKRAMEPKIVIMGGGRGKR